MDIFSQNINTIKKYHNYIDIALLTKETANDITVINTKNNSFSFKIKKTTFHSIFNPERDGLRFFEKNKYLVKDNICPVFLGTGFFFHIIPFLENFNFPKIVLIENNINIFKNFLKLFDCSSILSAQNIKFIINDNIDDILKEIEKLNIKNLKIIPYPPYLKVYDTFYSILIKKIHTSNRNIFDKLKYKKFTNPNVKILLISSKYFLMGEIVSALKTLDIEHEELLLNNDEFLTEDFIKILIDKISLFKPDFTFTINHLGVDREGVLMSLFEKIEMPLISWYVDNPNLIIKHFKKNISDFTTLLVWDKDNIEDMKKIGFANVHYLPLGVDINRFNNISLSNNPFKKLSSDIIFVGNSMIEKVKKSALKTKVPVHLLKMFKKVAVEFLKTDEKSVEKLIEIKFPELYEHFKNWNDIDKTNFETTVTWEATRIYRYKCVRKTINYTPLIIGDIGWISYFRDKIKYHQEINYYSELPYIYNIAKINFNTTSLQMKNAVNQRVFDVPACRQFIITDYRKQIENLFELEKEIICYKNIDEIPFLIDKYLNDTKQRKEIIKNAYKRVINHHTYIHRVKEIIEITKSIYG